jgi:hypothetical protein
VWRHRLVFDTKNFQLACKKRVLQKRQVLKKVSDKVPEETSENISKSKHFDTAINVSIQRPKLHKRGKCRRMQSLEPHVDQKHSRDIAEPRKVVDRHGFGFKVLQYQNLDVVGCV